MAIPAIPNSLIVQQGNQQVYLSFDISAGATSYSIQRSTDNVSFTALGTSAINNYLDTTVTLGTQYFYQVAAVNTSGTSPFTSSQSVIPAPVGEMSLSELRLRAQQRADRVNSNFITTAEWNSYINQSMTELYDLLITSFNDYFLANPIRFTLVTSQQSYLLPDGTLPFQDVNGNTIIPPAFYKLKGLDLGLNSSNNAFVTLSKFNFNNRNQYVYSTTGGTIYGAFNLQYRLMGNTIQFIPPPSIGQIIQMWYIPRLSMLIKDTDITTIGYSGWLEYVITDVAIKALQKEESDVTVVAAQKMALIKRIEETASNRDEALPETISDVRNYNGGYGSYGSNGPIGGF